MELAFCMLPAVGLAFAPYVWTVMVSTCPLHPSLGPTLMLHSAVSCSLCLEYNERAEVSPKIPACGARDHLM